MNSKYFDEPKLEVIRFDNTDIITTSGGYSGEAGYEEGTAEAGEDDVFPEI